MEINLVATFYKIMYGLSLNIWVLLTFHNRKKKKKTPMNHIHTQPWFTNEVMHFVNLRLLFLNIRIRINTELMNQINF